jgi:predicted SprT family Zn-dependent metalloprotease
LHNFSLTLPLKGRDFHGIVISVSGTLMRHNAAVPASSLPSLMMPCPVCAGRMMYRERSVSAEMEDTIYACRRCGAELVRTSMRNVASSGAEAA